MAGLFGSNAAAATTSSTTGDTSKDVEVPQGQLPKDSISDLMFSPAGDYLAVASWDQNVYIYEVNNSGATGKFMFTCKGPVLGVAWSKVCIRSTYMESGRYNSSQKRQFDPFGLQPQYPAIAI